MASPWPAIELGKATRSLDSKRVPVRAQDRRPGPYPYWGASGVVDHVDDFLFDHPALLVAEDGENLRSRKTPIAMLARGRYWVNNHAHVLVAGEGFDLKFLTYAVEASDVSGYLSGSTQPKLTAGSLSRLTIPAPPLDEQRRIAGVLSALDDLAGINERLRSSSTELAKAFMRRVAASEGIDEKLGDITTVRRGLSYKGSGLATHGLPMVNMGSAENFGWLKRSGLKYYTGEFKPRHLATSGDLLVVNTEQTWRNEILGWPLLVPSDVNEVLYSHHVYRLEFKEGWEWARLGVWAALFTPACRAQIEGTVRGTTVANLPVDGLERLTIRIPPRDHPSLALSATLLEEAWATELAIQQALDTRDELLPLLMSGRVRVGEVEDAGIV